MSPLSPRRDMSRRSKAQSCLRTPKLPNEPNLKTAPPAIPASREGQPEKIYKDVIFNILRINKNPLAASETTFKRQKNRSKIMQNACKKHVKKRSF
jgi:hypothetical protein